MHSHILLTICLVALASAAPDSLQWPSTLDPATELDDAWKAFKLKYNKTYANDIEEFAKKDMFAENLNAINLNNDLYSKGLQTFTMAINRFADLTIFEFVNRMTGHLPPQERSVYFSLSRDNVTSSFPRDNVCCFLPKCVDWRTRGYVTRVKFQGYNCGSCWAFSATGAVEGQHFRKTGKLVSLSEQQLIDCSKNNYGCGGGWQDKAFHYIAKNRGIDTEKSYPYEAINGSCRYKGSPSEATVKGYRRYHNLQEYQLQSLVASIGPLSVLIDVNHTSFQFYDRGIYYERNCMKTLWKLNHAVLVVGYGNCWGTRNKEYWIVKNSWGTNWGMNGYILMSRNRGNNCGIATAVSYPVV